MIARRRVAREMEIPDQFLGKIAQSLSRAGIIEISQGPRGGYRLTRAPGEISLLEVIEAVQGRLYLNQCLMRADSCGRSPYCAVHRVWQQARQALREVLAGADFATLASQDGGLEEITGLSGLAGGKG